MVLRNSRTYSVLLACLLSLLLLFCSLPKTTAQTTTPPYYVVNLVFSRISDDGTQVEVACRITNLGSASTVTTQVELIALDGSDNPRLVAITELPPLSANTSVDNTNQFEVTLTANLDLFTPNTRQAFRVQIASLPGQSTITSDTASFTIDIPGQTTSVATLVPLTPTSQTPAVNINLDLSNPEQIAPVIGIVASVLLIVLLLFRLVRLMFQRFPDFRSTWQPPYATVPPLDPYSASGIRQSWQPLAQNNLIMAPPAPGTLQVTKLLLGTDGRYLSGWQITALRLIQYDQYGRVSRSETLASAKLVRMMNRLASKSGTMSREKLLRRVKPSARRLVAQFQKRITPRSAMLPIAFDVRLKGVHGEVSIVFELYRCDAGYWQLVDRWQPEIMMMGRTLLENYTYSLFGQMGGETLRQFKRRLPDDLARVLVDMIGAKATTIEPTTSDAIPNVEHF